MAGFGYILCFQVNICMPWTHHPLQIDQLSSSPDPTPSGCSKPFYYLCDSPGGSFWLPLISSEFAFPESHHPDLIVRFTLFYDFPKSLPQRVISIPNIQQRVYITATRQPTIEYQILRFYVYDLPLLPTPPNPGFCSLLIVPLAGPCSSCHLADGFPSPTHFPYFPALPFLLISVQFHTSKYQYQKY